MLSGQGPVSDESVMNEKRQVVMGGVEMVCPATVLRRLVPRELRRGHLMGMVK